MIIKYFKPQSYVKNIYNIDLKRLFNDGYNILLCDLDNTLAAFDQILPNEDARIFVKHAQEIGFKVILCSNNTSSRIAPFANALEVEFSAFFCKPFKRNYKQLLKKQQLNNQKVVVIGDQLCTDILGGNRCHMYTIFTDPLVEVDSNHTKFSRIIEKRVIQYLTFRKQFKKGVYYGYKL